MASRLYLRRVKAHVGAGGHQQLLLARGPEFQTAVTSTVTGPTAGERVTDAAGGTQLRWLSRPLASGVTIADAITVNLWAFESNAAANAGLHVRIYRCDADGNVLSTIADSEQGTELGTTNAARNWTIAAGSVSDTLVAAGERIGLDVLINDAGGTMAAGHTVSLRYDDDDPAVNGDSYIDLTETITEGGTYYTTVYEPFDASSSDSWRDAPTGGIYSLKGSQSDYDMDGSVGTMVNTAAGTSEATRAAYLEDVKVQDSDLTVEVETDKAPTGNQQVHIMSRVVDENNLYRLHVQFTTSNTVQCSMERKHNDVYARMGSLVTVSGLTHAPGTRFKMRFQTAGINSTALKGKVWLASEAEPGTWDTEQTDSSANMQVAAGVGLRTWMESASNLPITVTWANFTTTGLTTHALTATLSFTSALGRTADRIIEAGEIALDFAGSLVGDLLDTLAQSFNAALDFTGSLTRKTIRPVAAVLDFTTEAQASLRKLLALSATLDFSGAVSREGRKVLTAALTPAGSLTRRARKLLAGSLTPGGTISRSTSRALAATLDFVGSVSGVLNGGAQQFQKALNATLDFTGSLTRRTGKVLTASLSPAGAVAAAGRFRRALGATLAPGGALRRSTGRAVAATLSPAASLTRQTRRALSAILSPAGNLSVQLIGALAIAFNATLTFATSFTRRARLLLDPLGASLDFTASLATSSTLRRTFTATVDFSAEVRRSTAKLLSGALSPTGAIVRLTRRAIAATLSPAGALSAALEGGAQQFQQAFTAALTFSGSIAKEVQHRVTAALTPAAELARTTRRSLSATLAPAGAIARLLTRHVSVTAALDLTSALTRQTSRSISAALDPTGELNRLTRRALSATVSFVGAFVTRVITPLRNRGFVATPRSSGSTSSRSRGSTGERD